MNKAESDFIACYLSSLGGQQVASPKCADVIVLNTCVVRQSAEDKVLGMLGFVKGLKARRPDLKVLVTGCFVDSDIHRLERVYPHVDQFFAPGDFSKLKEWVQDHVRLSSSAWRHKSGWIVREGIVSALVPIMQGCNNFCSYCIVPYRRGRERSRPLKEIVSQVEELVSYGTKEIVLLGQNVNSYGRDLLDNTDLASLLRELNKIEGIYRIRFLTNHPKDMSRHLIETIASLDKVCAHISLPLQSGDNDVLRAMRRGYTVEQYEELVNTIRCLIPGVALSTDVIVGFPEESDEQFRHTLSVLERVRFDTVHVAAYSPRPGTLAAREYRDSVPPNVKQQRLQEVEALQTRIAREINAQLEGNNVEILVEGKKGGKWFGRTRTNKLTFFDSTSDCLGRLVCVSITKTTPWALQGQLVC